MLLCAMSRDGCFVGSFAISKNGHDKGEIYVITAIVDDKFVLVANGENRPLMAPKRKNIRHIFVANRRTAATNDIDLKKAIRDFKKETKKI